MLDMGFEEQIREVMRSLPEDHQTLLFSATMPVEIEALAGDYLNKPVRVKVGVQMSGSWPRLRVLGRYHLARSWNAHVHFWLAVGSDKGLLSYSCLLSIRNACPTSSLRRFFPCCSSGGASGPSHTSQESNTKPSHKWRFSLWTLLKCLVYMYPSKHPAFLDGTSELMHWTVAKQAHGLAQTLQRPSSHTRCTGQCLKWATAT